MKYSKLHFHIFAFSIWDKGYSGGDRIFIELSRRFVEEGNDVSIYTWERGRAIIAREKLQGVIVQIYLLEKWLRLGFAFQYGVRILAGIFCAMFMSPKVIENNRATIVYCSSDFWMDSLPCFILKLRFPKITWIGTFYLSAPNPFRGFKENGSLRFPSLNNTLYWLQQKPMYFIMKRYADFIFVTSEPDAEKFPYHKKREQYFIVKGGVDTTIIEKFKDKHEEIDKKYDAIFMGRFHPQKGVLELMDIWYEVMKKKPAAQLVMIGDGPLMPQVKERIKKLGLNKNISLQGYVLDGEKKYKLFLQSKIFVHPAIYDSGGMSAAEGMVWGLPAVSFDLVALRTYYPRGMVKVPLGDNTLFAREIIKLLNDKSFYKKVQDNAVDLINKEWSWDKRSSAILKKLQGFMLQ